MKPLDSEAKRIIAQANEADVAPDAAQARIWQHLSQRIDAPLPPTAAAASRALGARGFVGAFSGALAKLGLGVTVIGALGAGAAWYLVTHAPEHAPVRRTDTSELRAPATQPLALRADREALPAQDGPGEQPAAPAVQRPKPKNSALQAEATLIADAQRALNAAAPARALALLARHRARFPRGELAPERDAAQVFALCAMGRTAEALAARERFLRGFPESPLAARVRAGCGG